MSEIYVKWIPLFSEDIWSNLLLYFVSQFQYSEDTRPSSDNSDGQCTLHTLIEEVKLYVMIFSGGF